jgi:hypothetical protein
MLGHHGRLRANFGQGRLVAQEDDGVRGERIRERRELFVGHIDDVESSNLCADRWC